MPRARATLPSSVSSALEALVSTSIEECQSGEFGCGGGCCSADLAGEELMQYCNSGLDARAALMNDRRFVQSLQVGFMHQSVFTSS